MAKPQRSYRMLTNRQVDGWRAAVKIATIRGQLHKFIMGEIEMTAAQVSAAKLLLDKAIPSLASVEHSGSVDHRNVTEMSDAEIFTRLQELRGGGETARRGDGPQEGALLIAGVHGVHDPDVEGGEDPPSYQ